MLKFEQDEKLIIEQALRAYIKMREELGESFEGLKYLEERAASAVSKIKALSED